MLDLLQRRDSDVGDITWFYPEAYGVSYVVKWLFRIAKKKGKFFDQPGISLESAQNRERSSSIKSLL